jgi:hypothetical protein
MGFTPLSWNVSVWLIVTRVTAGVVIVTLVAGLAGIVTRVAADEEVVFRYHTYPFVPPATFDPETMIVTRPDESVKLPMQSIEIPLPNTHRPSNVPVEASNE